MNETEVEEEIVDKIAEERTNKLRKYEGVKVLIMKKVMITCVLATIIVGYWLILLLCRKYLEKELFISICRNSNLVILMASIVLFEIAYKKDNRILAIHGIEMMVLAIFNVFIPYVYYEVKSDVRTYLALVGIFMGIYYSLKAVIIYILEKKKYIKYQSDISRIIKKESKDKKNIEDEYEQTEEKKEIREENWNKSKKDVKQRKKEKEVNAEQEEAKINEKKLEEEKASKKKERRAEDSNLIEKKNVKNEQKKAKAKAKKVEQKKLSKKEEHRASIRDLIEEKPIDMELVHDVLNKSGLETDEGSQKNKAESRKELKERIKKIKKRRKGNRYKR